jgi:hypothetical protein
LSNLELAQSKQWPNGKNWANLVTLPTDQPVETGFQSSSNTPQKTLATKSFKFGAKPFFRKSLELIPRTYIHVCICRDQYLPKSNQKSPKILITPLTPTATSVHPGANPTITSYNSQRCKFLQRHG